MDVTAGMNANDLQTSNRINRSDSFFGLKSFGQANPNGNLHNSHFGLANVSLHNRSFFKVRKEDTDLRKLAPKFDDQLD
jgi:hypothetical protein